MSLKKFLILPLIISIAAFLYFSDEVVSSFRIVTDTITITPSLIAVLIAATVLQMIGHVIRAYKMRFLLLPVKPSTTRFQFRALTIGYLINTLLPFRIGELIRTQVIASAERISFGLALVLIIIERSLDAAILAFIGLILLWLGLVSSTALVYVALLFIVSMTVLLVALIIASEKSQLLFWWHKFTQFFSPGITLQLRFKAWSIIYGLQRIFTRKRAVHYLGFTVASWIFYILSIGIVAQYFIGDLPLGERVATSLSPYYGISLPTGPASLGTFSDAANALSNRVQLDSNTRLTFNLISWGLLVGPVALLGIAFLFIKTKETLWRRLPKGASHEAMAEKLSRTEDFSYELTHFLDNYFSGNSLSQIVHRLELRHDFRLLRYFKGGSDAITILALQGKQVVVKKIIPADLTDRLQAQYKWLRRRAKNRGIVRALREHEQLDYYAIDLEYDEHNEMFFDFMHSNSAEDSQQVMRTVWGYLSSSIYATTEIVTDKESVEQYIQTHIFGCLDKSVAVNEELMLATQPKKIKINGNNYHNLHQVMSKIVSNKRIMLELATYARSEEVHGDVAVDNILVSSKTGKPLLIDPAPDGNIINGPVFDFGKNMQSLYCGYEFLFRGNEAVSLGEDGSIRYRDNKSVQYMQLCDYVRKELAPQYLSEGEQRSILFHAGALHIRRLKHQVYQNPANVLAIYAVGVKTLNDFLAQYEKP